MKSIPLFVEIADACDHSGVTASRRFQCWQGVRRKQLQHRPDTPTGTLKVISSDANPNYRYNPDYKFKGVKTKKPFTIDPGPNNPAGSYWIGLSAESYGIHGTPNPSKVGKSESHGCVRLTNWDVTWLGKNVKKGTPVAFIDEPQGSGRKTD
jgi:lipoprotein-anchoring transpeptidase ErfK/SrfK